MATNRSIRPIVIMGFSVIFVTFGVFGGWAAVAKLDAAVVAPGTISLEGNRKVVQHLEGGIVDEILVKEGDVVQEGQPLLRLNSIENQSNLQVFTFRSDVARIVEARLLAERYLKDSFELPEELQGVDLAAKGLQETVDDQRGLFEDRRMILRSQTEILNSRIEQTNEQIRGLEQQKSALERRYENFGQMIDRFFMTSQWEAGTTQAEEDIGIVGLFAQTHPQQLGTFTEPPPHEFHNGDPVARLIVAGLLAQDGFVGLESFIQPPGLREPCRAFKKLSLRSHGRRWA